MELSERIDVARRALATLDEVLAMRASPVARDAAIQRFEYTFEATWKAAQAFLAVEEGVEVASPKSAIRAAATVGLFDDSRIRDALEMADDRNLSVHTYAEELADEIFGRLKDHAELLRGWIVAMRSRLDED